MKKHSKLTFASMLTAAGAMICLANCVNTPATGDMALQACMSILTGMNHRNFPRFDF